MSRNEALIVSEERKMKSESISKTTSENEREI